MPDIIRRHDNKNVPIIPLGSHNTSLTYFNLLELRKGQSYQFCVPNVECVCVVLSGNCDVRVDSRVFKDVGKRKDIWTGRADSVYAPSGNNVEIRANSDNTEMAVAGGYCPTSYEAFRITPDEQVMVEVGSSATKTHRRIYHILGQNGEGRAGNLVVNELYAEEGCWSGYPPHKHDTELKGEKNVLDETAFEEVYHFRFNPETGFGAQIVYQPDMSSQAFLTRNGDTVVIDKGFHPTVTSPGHDEYIFAILVGKHHRSLIQNFQKEHRYLISRFPGISDMQEKYK